MILLWERENLTVTVFMEVVGFGRVGPGLPDSVLHPTRPRGPVGPEMTVPPKHSSWTGLSVVLSEVKESTTFIVGRGKTRR